VFNFIGLINVNGNVEGSEHTEILVKLKSLDLYPGLLVKCLIHPGPVISIDMFSKRSHRSQY